MDVYYAPRNRVAVCFDGGSCAPDIQRGIVLVDAVQMYVVLTQ